MTTLVKPIVTWGTSMTWETSICFFVRILGTQILCDIFWGVGSGGFWRHGHNKKFLWELVQEGFRRHGPNENTLGVGL